MEFKNIWKDITPPLQLNKDERGEIVDIFYNENINHVASINSKPNTIRGNHYHKLTTQHILITKGSLVYWFKNYNSSDPSRSIEIFEGDIISTPPMEIHALEIGEKGNQFIVFSSGLRGGKDYEDDTYRVKSIIGSK
tara:strand:+ start:91 stop:501 length:411 start_codon:yes stop_codon:yes gene_type:complete